jgi:hypothetical protein
MAGKVQHEIPRLYQRGFLIPDTGDAERVWVFKPDTIYPSNILRSAAESYFYSELPKAGERTLDDEITEYERDRLTALVATLRAHNPGDLADGDTAAEVIAHLTTRNGHIRGAFKSGLETMASSASEIFTDEDTVRRVAGIDGPMIPDRFREMIGGTLNNLSIPNRDQFPAGLLEMMLFAAVREGFSPIFQGQMATMKAQLNLLFSLAPTLVRDGHNKALADSFVPDARTQDLSGFTWRVNQSPVDLILPDCVALAFGDDGAEPLMMAGTGKKNIVVLPLTTRTALVGGREDEAVVDLSSFNEAAANCSHAYFLASSRTPEFEALCPYIGTVTDRMIGTAVQGSFDKLTRAEEILAPEDQADGPVADPAGSPIGVSIQGQFDPDAVPVIMDALKEVLAQAAWTMGFDRLDGITIADDYARAVAAIDRGVSGLRSATARNDEYGTGIAQCVTIKRDGVLKGHVVVQSVVAHNLISENEADRAWAGYVLANQIVQADITKVFDDALPGVMLSNTCRDLVAVRQTATDRAWIAYFASRATAHFDLDHLAEAQGQLMHALEIAWRVIPQERVAYQQSQDLDQLVGSTVSAVNTVLEIAASLLGHADGAGVDPIEGAPDLASDLTSRELLAWLADYRRDLVWLWDRRGQWRSYDEFLALGRHMDRLLWPHQIVPWTTEERWGFQVPPDAS